MIVMGGAGSSVELVGNRVELGLAVDQQVCTFRKVLPQQAIGVLAGAELPGAVGGT